VASSLASLMMWAAGAGSRAMQYANRAAWQGFAGLR
jgi:hypothetical protein